jgi:hypothetical protein
MAYTSTWSEAKARLLNTICIHPSLRAFVLESSVYETSLPFLLGWNSPPSVHLCQAIGLQRTYCHMFKDLDWQLDLLDFSTYSVWLCFTIPCYAHTLVPTVTFWLLLHGSGFHASNSIHSSSSGFLNCSCASATVTLTASLLCTVYYSAQHMPLHFKTQDWLNALLYSVSCVVYPAGGSNCPLLTDLIMWLPVVA